LAGNFAWNCDFHVNSGIFYMPQICDMGPTALLPFRRKVCQGFCHPEKFWRLRPGLNPDSWVLKGSTLSLDHRSRLSTPKSSEFSPSFRFPHQPLYAPLLSTTCVKNLIILYPITWILFCKGYMSWSSSLHNLLHPTATLSLLGPNIFPSTLYSNTLSISWRRNTNKMQ